MKSRSGVVQTLLNDGIAWINPKPTCKAPHQHDDELTCKRDFQVPLPPRPSVFGFSKLRPFRQGVAPHLRSTLEQLCYEAHTVAAPHLSTLKLHKRVPSRLTRPGRVLGEGGFNWPLCPDAVCHKAPVLEASALLMRRAGRRRFGGAAGSTSARG